MRSAAMTARRRVERHAGYPDPWRRLCAAMCVKATADAQSADPATRLEARVWYWRWGLSLCEMIDIPPSRVIRWLMELD